MLFKRFFAALAAALMIAGQAIATEQSSYVTPDTGPMSMGSFVDTALNPALRAIAACHWGTSAPANGPSSAPLPYQFWCDTTTNPVVVKRNDGASWVIEGKLNTSTHTWTPSYQGTDTGTASIATTGASGHTLGFLDGANTYSGTSFFSSQFGLSGVITPTALSADQNDYNPSGLSGAAVIRQDGGAADRNITGLAGGVAGRVVEIINVGATNSLILKDQSASSSAANRFLHGADLTIGPNKAIVLRYDDVSSKWRTFDRGLGNTGVTAATYGDATHVGQFTVDVMGRISAASSIVVAPPFSAVTGSWACSQAPAFTGDVTTTAATCANVLGNIPTGVTMAGTLLAAGIAAPSTPATGKGAVYFDSTSKNLAAKNDACVINHGVQTKAAVTSFWLRSIADDGSVGTSQPLFSDISGSFVCSQQPAETGGDVTSSAGSCVLSIGASKVVSAMLNADVFSTAHSWGGVQTLAAPVFTGLVDNQGAHKDSTQSTPAQITADQNNYNPSSVVCSSSTTLIINSDAARNITGIAGGVAGCDLYVFNNGSFTITMKDGSASSTAANRFDLGADFGLASKAAAHFKYDGNGLRWRNATGSGSGGGGAGTVTQVNSDGVTTCGGPITTSGTISVCDAQRQNWLLNAAYQAKLYGGYRRMINLFADGYKASDGVNAGSSSNYTVDTTGGKVSPSVTAGTNQLLTNFTGYTNGSQVISTSSDGAGNEAYLASNNNTSDFWQSSSLGQYWQIDFGSAKTIASYTIWPRGTGTTNSPTAWTLKASNTGAFSGEETTLDTRSSVGGWSGAAQSFTIASPGSFRYYRFNFTASTNSINVAVAEFTMIASPTTNNMTLVTTSQTADATIGNGRVLLEYDNTATPTLGTDLTAEVTCNGGTNWTSATLSSVSTNGQAGRKVVETADTACGTTGTSFAARIKTFNNKSVPVYATVLAVH